jgi:hypothetical protein
VFFALKLLFEVEIVKNYFLHNLHKKSKLKIFKNAPENILHTGIQNAS